MVSIQRRAAASHSLLFVLSKPTSLILLAGLLAYVGASFLGFGTDTYSDLEMYRSQPLWQVALNPIFNRYPAWGLLVYPALLLLPTPLAHLLVIAVHTLASLLLCALLRSFGLRQGTATLAALLFLLWPAHYEALFWLSGAMSIFGVCAALGGALLLVQRRFASALALVFFGMLFSEGIFFPALFLVGYALWRLKAPPSRLLLVLGTLVVGYALLQLLRIPLSLHGHFAPYRVGLGHIPKNAAFLLLMTLGVASSRDVVWMWLATRYPADVGLLLPIGWLLLAFAVALPMTLALRSHSTRPRLAYQPTLQWRGMAVALAGCIVSFLIFLPLMGNEMQARYTTTAVAYLSVLLALPLSWLLAHRRPALVSIGVVCTLFLLGWSIYRAWSTIWANGYPARVVSERIIDDARQTYNETGVRRIWLVNEPRSVGNIFAIGRDWGYRAAARQRIGPAAYLASDELMARLVQQDFVAGSSFSDEPCVFLSWRGGRRVVARQVAFPDKGLLLDCTTGRAEPLGSGPPPTLVVYPQEQISRDSYAEFVGPRSDGLATTLWYNSLSP